MKTNQLKKLGLAIISAVMMFSSALGNLGIVSAKEVKYSIREYETGYKTDRGTNLLKLRIKGADILIMEHIGGRLLSVYSMEKHSQKDHISLIMEILQEFIEMLRESLILQPIDTIMENQAG